MSMLSHLAVWGYTVYRPLVFCHVLVWFPMHHCCCVVVADMVRRSVCLVILRRILFVVCGGAREYSSAAAALSQALKQGRWQQTEEHVSLLLRCPAKLWKPLKICHWSFEAQKIVLGTALQTVQWFSDLNISNKTLGPSLGLQLCQFLFSWSGFLWN